MEDDFYGRVQTSAESDAAEWNFGQLTPSCILISLTIKIIRIISLIFRGWNTVLGDIRGNFVNWFFQRDERAQTWIVEYVICGAVCADVG